MEIDAQTRDIAALLCRRLNDLSSTNDDAARALKEMVEVLKENNIIVNVPEQPVVVNVPQQAAPIVNVEVPAQSPPVVNMPEQKPPVVNMPAKKPSAYRLRVTGYNDDGRVTDAMIEPVTTLT